MSFVLLLAAVLGLNLLFVRHANLTNARRVIDEDLRGAAQVFERVFQLRLEKLSLGARLMSDDWAFRRLFGETDNFADPLQRRTLLSGLENYRARMRDSAFLQLVSLDAELLADTANPEIEGLPAYEFPALLHQAEQSADLRAIRFETARDGALVLLIAVPLLIPEPSGWIVAGFPVDDSAAADFRDLTGVEVSFVHRVLDRIEIAASSLPPATRDVMSRGGIAWQPDPEPVLFDRKVDGEIWIGTLRPLPGDQIARAMLHRSLSREMAPFRRLEATLGWLTITALALSALVAGWLARGISRPVQDLSAAARRIGEGIYDVPVPVRASDEIGNLARTFNDMANGLIERDKVRDLLGRNVSPEVAAELLRRPAALGGEEREATILFSDIRGFTSFSETVTPSALLDMLNHYFTELTRVIEQHGGVVDKYIGDAVMAVFGAPASDAAHEQHAVECIRAIREVMRAYNVRRAQEGFPVFESRLGLASGRIVAGVMGSTSRHNYTVIGDPVNLAARLQDEAKKFEAWSLIAASTVEASGHADWFKPLGEVAVRGKSCSVAVFTLRDDLA